MHFNGRELKCKNCEDYIASLCPGNQFETVEDCMMDKAKNANFMDSGIFSNLD